MKSVLITLLTMGILQSQFPPVGNIEVYGLRKASREEVLRAVGLKEGDPGPASDSEAEELQKRVQRIAGVVRAKLTIGCCTAGKSSLFVGIEEEGAPRLEFHSAPQNDIKLPEEVFENYQRCMTAWGKAVQQGDNEDNMDSGHSLMTNASVRALQERFIVQAAEHLDRLRAVLRNSYDAEQRAAAAWVIGYAPDKRLVIDDLLYATRDPDDGVRNNAMRALGAITVLARRKPELGIRVSPDPFIEFLNSISLSDRNKALAILVSLTTNRPPDVLGEIRKGALSSLVEMARWKEYDRFSYTLLGRMAGLTEKEIEAASTSEQREKVIVRVMKLPRPEGL
jgi:HEAT repeats